ncbi:hypothetical protein AD998_02905 [bacterium 336/3]|nr:hypothetical protein AD998_02905 [bacterium 336/3]
MHLRLFIYFCITYFILVACSPKKEEIKYPIQYTDLYNPTLIDSLVEMRKFIPRDSILAYIKNTQQIILKNLRDILLIVFSLTK